MAGDVHDGLVAGAALCKLGDQCVPAIMPAAFHTAFSLTEVHAVPSVVIGTVGSVGSFPPPPGNRNQPSLVSPNRWTYRLASSTNASKTPSFSVMVRPVPTGRSERLAASIESGWSAWSRKPDYRRQSTHFRRSEWRWRRSHGLSTIMLLQRHYVAFCSAPRLPSNSRSSDDANRSTADHH